MSNPSQRWRVVIGVIWSVFCFTQAAPAHADESHKGTLVIAVQNPDAPATNDYTIYIFGGTPNRRMLEVQGTAAHASFDLVPGTYRVYAAQVRALPETVLHSVTPEAKIEIEEGETATVILSLNPQAVPDSDLTEARLRRMGLDPRFAQNVD